MAFAKIKTITKIVETRVGEQSIHLYLSLDEARFIVEVLQHVAGSPSKSARRHQAPISSALGQALGYSEKDGRLIMPSQRPPVSGFISFLDEA